MLPSASVDNTRAPPQSAGPESPSRGYPRPATAIVAIENQCTPDRTNVVRSVWKSFQLLL
ncbi:hypothetical protein EGO51_17115 [Haloarcula hispanica]|uniref:Uncharacterized protein n=1 Tax=Haloarcula hispanica TaxID=51589 RepID=A0A5J5LFQ3_HALHI|nr:hypothetical protein EGO51_17115 [Haloarcula hispanica]